MYGPIFPRFYEERDSFKVIFRNAIVDTGTQQGNSNRIIDKILEYCKEPKTAKEIRDYIGVSPKSYVASNLIKPLIDGKMLDYTNKNSINARNQKYITLKKEWITLEKSPRFCLLFIYEINKLTKRENRYFKIILIMSTKEYNKLDDE